MNQEYCPVKEKVDETRKKPAAENPASESPPTLKFNQCEDGNAFCKTATNVVGIINSVTKNRNSLNCLSLNIGNDTATNKPVTTYKRYCLALKTANTGSLKLVNSNNVKKKKEK